MPENDQNQADLTLLTELAIEAGKIGMKWFGQDPQVWMKEGQSPVSEADFAINDFLLQELSRQRPDYGWLSEESDDDEARLQAKRVVVVDPIDGTRGFINGMNQWCVSIAIVESNRPVVGVLECPAVQQTITATKDAGAWCNGKQISSARVHPRNAETVLRVTGPRSLQTATSAEWPMKVEKLSFVPSLAYRLAMIAMGEVDLSLARASAKDWDLAAADLIVHEADARLTDLEGEQLTYNCQDVRHGTLVASAKSHHDEMLDLARTAINKSNN